MARLTLVLSLLGFLSLLASCALPYGSARAATTDDAAALRRDGGGKVIPYDAVETTLDNGLKVIVVPTGFPNLVSLQIPVQTGSRNEIEPGKTGFAHFFEHMMFRGTEKYPPDDYQAIITRAGARQNAYTTDDYTNYHVTFAKEDLEKILEIEADRFQHLKYPLEMFQTEAKAVLGEYNKNFANPIQKLFEAQQDRAFKTHTYKHTTMGFLRDIEEMPNQFEYAQTFFDRWYRPEYTTVIVAGDVDPDRVISLVNKYWGGWERGSWEIEIPQEPAPNGPVYAYVPWEAPTLPLLAVSFHGPAFSETDKDAAAMGLLLNLRFDETSDLYRRLVQEEQKVDLFGGINAESKDPSLITILARVKDPKDLVYVRNAILETVARIRTEPVSADELAEAKSNLRYGTAARFDTTEAIASTLARYVHFDRRFDTFDNLFALIDTVTPEDLQQAAQTYFTDERMVVVALANDDPGVATSSLPRLDSFAAAAGSGGDAAAIGTVLQTSQSPQIVMKLAFEAGSSDDPKGKEGLAELAARMVAEAGSERHDYARIQKLLYPMAGGFGASVDRELTVFTGSVHRDNLDAYLDVVLPQLLQPGMRDDDFARNQDAQKNALVQDLRSNNDEELGKEVLQARVFFGTGYAHPTLGTEKGIAALTPDDVRAFIAKHYTAANLTLGLSGDLPDGFEETLKARLAAGLARAADAGAADDANPRGAIPAGITATIVDKETRATAISFGHPIEVTRAHPDYVPLYLARTWLGEHRSSLSHLYQRIREERGMNYGDYAYIEAFPGGGRRFFPPTGVARRAQLFEVWIRPVESHENAHHALRIALHEIEKLVANGMTTEQFESTRDYLMKNLYVMTDGQAVNLGYALDSAWYGIPDYVTMMRERLQSLTLDEVNAAIEKHIHPDHLHVVFVTKDGAALKERLVAETPSAMKYTAEKPKALLDEDAQIGARKLGLKPDAVTVVPVENVFEG